MSIKGINNKPFINLIKDVDIEKFDDLHSEICSGFVKAQKNCQYGLLTVDPSDQKFINLNNYENKLKPVYLLYDDFVKLPDNDPIKIAGNEFKDNDLILYLTYALGAHNTYKIYTLFDFGNNWEITNNKKYCDGNEYFSKTISWINDLKIFKTIGRAYFLIVEGGGISIEHCDPKENGINEFIHIRSDMNRPFYIKDQETQEKFYIDTRVCYFNDQDFHGGEAAYNSTYVLRIDGIFTDEFREKIWR